ncbi:MAG: hypothetical protein JNM10_02455 [Planctomycetia bacterium]|nr:hypothetical protein [Planctomycetia bacterium]
MGRQGLSAAAARTALVFAAALAGVVALDARTPRRARAAAPTDAGEVARLVAACRAQRPTAANGSADARRPWLRLAELRDPAAVPFLLARFSADPHAPCVLGEVLAAHGGPALVALVRRLLDPNLPRGAAEAAIETLLAMDDDALFALDAVPDLPAGFRDVLERWVRRRGAPHGPPSGWRTTLAAFVPEPVVLPDDGWSNPDHIPFETNAWRDPRPDPFAAGAETDGPMPRPRDLAPEALRRVRFRRADGRPWVERSGGATLVAILDPTDPPPWDDATFAAFAWVRPSGRWEFELDGDDLVLPHVPAVALHVLGLADGVPFHVHVDPFARDVVYDPVPGGQPVAGRPVVDGRPVPDGTVLAPGRLDLTTVRALAVRPARERGFSALVFPGLDRAPVPLPAADTLTAWHPSFGVAWLPWRGDVVPAGPSLPGRIEVDAGPGRADRRLELAVELPSPGVWSSGPPVPPHAVPWPATGRGALVGLPPGAYVVRVGAVARAVRLADDAPVAVVSLRP